MKYKNSHKVQKNILLLFIDETEFLCYEFSPSNHSTQPYHSYYVRAVRNLCSHFHLFSNKMYNLPE